MFSIGHDISLVLGQSRYHSGLPAGRQHKGVWTIDNLFSNENELSRIRRAKKIDRQVLLRQFLQTSPAFEILLASESVVFSSNAGRGEKVRHVAENMVLVGMLGAARSDSEPAAGN
jgi:hypothetical protein